MVVVKLLLNERGKRKTERVIRNVMEGGEDQPCIGAGWLPSKKQRPKISCAKLPYSRIIELGRPQPFLQRCGKVVGDRIQCRRTTSGSCRTWRSQRTRSYRSDVMSDELAKNEIKLREHKYYGKRSVFVTMIK